MPTDHERLHRLIEQRCIIEGDFVLSTGAKSRYYFDCKTVALDGEGLTLIAGEFLREIEKLPVKPTAIGGLTMGADFITAAVIMMSHQTGGAGPEGPVAPQAPQKPRARPKNPEQPPPPPHSRPHPHPAPPRPRPLAAARAI